MEVLTPAEFEDPEDGFGLQQAVLEGVGSGARGATAVLWSSSRYVALTRPETRLSGFPEAARRMSALGFPVLLRNSGGGAVAANPGALSFSMTFPIENLRHGLYERYAEGSRVVVAALRGLGVEAEEGEVEAEFCPGAYSVRSGGERGIKAAGLAQRVTRRTARVEALILVSSTEEIRSALSSLYPALGMNFRPEGVGDLAGSTGPLSVQEVAAALTKELEESYGAARADTDDRLLSRAVELRGSWRASS